MSPGTRLCPGLHPRSGRRTATIIALAVAVLLPTAGPVAAQGAGSSASTVLRIPPAPRPLGLGNALVAVRDVWALEYNPAGTHSDSTIVSAAYQALPVGASAGAAVLVGPVGRVFTLGVSLRFVDYGRVDVIEPDPTLPIGHPTGETATGGEQTLLASGSVRWRALRVGVAGRWLRMDVDRLVDDVVAADAGVSLSLARWLDVGAAIQNVGPELEAGRAAPLPRTVRAGAAVRRDLGPLDAVIALEGRRREERTVVGTGLEVGVGGAAFEALARLGYESRAAAGDAYSRFVFGGGVRVDRLVVDLAYRALGPLGSTRQVGVAYRF
jgi:hypothetical protein